MGNLTRITNSFGVEIGRLDFTLFDVIQVNEIISKYVIGGMSIFSKNINDTLKHVYEVATDVEAMTVLLVMNDKTVLGDDAVKTLTEVAETGPYDKIKDIARQLSNLIIEHGEITLEFVGVDMGDGFIEKDKIQETTDKVISEIQDMLS